MNFILPYKEAEEILREDIKQIKETGFFDFKSKTPVYSTKKALEEKGIMLGLLIARTKSGERVVLRAFSGALNSSYLVEGYTPPCFSVKETPTSRSGYRQYRGWAFCLPDIPLQSNQSHCF